MMRSCSSQYVTGSDSPEGQCDLLAEEVLVGGQVIGLVNIYQRSGALVRLGRKIARLPAGIFVIGRDDHKEANMLIASEPIIVIFARWHQEKVASAIDRFRSANLDFHAALRQEKDFAGIFVEVRLVTERIVDKPVGIGRPD